jgi:hypothetical protein
MEDWDGVDRRAVKRRYTTERRRGKYWLNLLAPIAMGVILTGIVSWGVYVTHTTYNISAKYEETFIGHIEGQEKKEVYAERRRDAIVVDYNRKIDKLSDEVADGFREIRDGNNSIINLLLKREASKQQGRVEER